MKIGLLIFLVRADNEPLAGMLKALSSLQGVLDDVPDIFSGMTEFTASYTGTETEVADTD